MSHTRASSGGTIPHVRTRDLIERIHGSLERIDGRLELIDRHLEEGSAHRARGNEVMDDVREELRLSRADRERTRASTERLFTEMHSFMRDQTRRVDRVMSRVERHLIANTNALGDLTGAVRDSTDATKAHEHTLNFILDELRGPPPDESPA
jgi:chromosome segregation ATPase